ncbi:MAG: fibrobacter succinogenes major paralogous domain-containing protein [Prevotellaceae bacterium]|jgi:hypothetical protein|nr:fibrobacter succinogenes major paralogous domain-containing protein [Prevotellaceae bacterium]
MKRILTVIMLCGIFSAYAQKTPPYAVSTRTWKIGNQVWSDVIRMPDCNKSNFINSNTTPDCRSYTYRSVTYFYYNWAYVYANRRKMCPSPWRVPTKRDFERLCLMTERRSNWLDWGYGGGIAKGTGLSGDGDIKSYSYYWSATEIDSDSDGAAFLHFNSNVMTMTYTGKEFGMQVRCVCDQ